MSMKIFHRRYSLAFKEPVRTAHGMWERREGIIIRIETEQGGLGFGEVAPIPEFGTETVSQAEAALHGLDGGISEEGIASIAARLPCTSGALRAAFGMAERSLAGRPDEIRSVESRDGYLRVAALLPAGRGALMKCESLAERGFRIFKWKVGVGDAADEMGMMDDLLAKLPNGSKLRLDANGAWDRRQAERWLARCADRPIEHLEQPIAAAANGSEDLLLGLADDFPTPIALDESLVLDGDIERWLGLGWNGVYVIKPMLIADLRLRCAQLAARNAQVVFSSALETAIGARIVLQAAFDWPGEKRALGTGVWPLFADDRFDGPAASPFFKSDDFKFLSTETLWSALN
ncbi:MAG: o-succinylbenzoate synthase [Opitutaceae bacterium]|jgi:O-succinylbenzoate synthase